MIRYIARNALLANPAKTATAQPVGPRLRAPLVLVDDAIVPELVPAEPPRVAAGVIESFSNPPVIGMGYQVTSPDVRVTVVLSVDVVAGYCVSGLTNDPPSSP